MRNILFLIAFCLMVFSAKSQVNDSLMIHRIDSMINDSKLLIRNNDFNKALEINVTAESLAIEHIGKETQIYGNCLHNHGRILAIRGDLTESLIWFNEAIRIRELVLGRTHPDFATSISSAGIVYKNLGDFKHAESMLSEAKVIREKTLGKAHPEVANSLYNLAMLYVQMGELQKTKEIFLESKSNVETYFGKKNPDYASCLNNLANVYKDLGEYENAEQLYLEAKTLRDEINGKSTEDYAACLSNLGTLYDLMGRFRESESYHLAAKSIREELFGKNHFEYAASLNGLGALYYHMGYFEKTELLFKEAIEIRLALLGPENPDYAQSVCNLANLYKEMGNYEKSELLFNKAIEIRKKVLGENHPDYAMSLDALAGLYQEMSQFKKAEPINLEAINIREKAVGKKHPDYSNSLNNLGLLYQKMGNYEKAESFLLMAKSNREEIFGSEHPEYFVSLHNLANLYLEIGSYEKAESLYVEAGAICEKILGKEHPYYSENLIYFANLKELTSNPSAADSILAEYFMLTQNRLTNAISYLSEQELSSFISKFQFDNNKLSSLIYRRTQSHVSRLVLNSLNFNNAVFYKGFLLNASKSLSALAKSSIKSEELFNKLRNYRSRIVAELSKPLADQVDLSEIKDKANIIEKEFARTTLGYSEIMKQINYKEILRALKPDESVIEFTSFKLNFPIETDSLMYAAIVLNYGENYPNFIPLFEEKQLKRLMGGNKTSVNVSQVYSMRGTSPIERTTYSGVYELIWKPLINVIKEHNTIYYSTTGLMHRINFDAIPLNDSTILTDKYQLIRMGSTRTIVIPFSNKNITDDLAVLFGGIQFNLDTTISFFTNAIKSDKSSAFDNTLAINSKIRGSSDINKEWRFLPGTLTEIQALSGLFKASRKQSIIFDGQNATEESIKSIGQNGNSPRILHMATHGYFFNERIDTLSKNENNTDEPVFKASENPMIRSGLILAGANYAWNKGRPFQTGMEDGILTAFEISQMNLSNTELVVLSACETGLGDIQGNEGVYGLQRAFKIAGAKYLMMSLWQVPDEETKEFMVTFYKNWLGSESKDVSKMSIPEAFRKTQKQMRERFVDPYQWAGFVLVE